MAQSQQLTSRLPEGYELDSDLFSAKLAKMTLSDESLSRLRSLQFGSLNQDDED
jgi:hypothetical protein